MPTRGSDIIFCSNTDTRKLLCSNNVDVCVFSQWNVHKPQLKKQRGAHPAPSGPVKMQDRVQSMTFIWAVVHKVQPVKQFHKNLLSKSQTPLWMCCAVILILHYSVYYSGLTQFIISSRRLSRCSLDWNKVSTTIGHSCGCVWRS